MIWLANSNSLELEVIVPTHPPRKAPMGFRAGRGAASAIRRAEVWKPRAASARLPEMKTLDGRDIISRVDWAVAEDCGV